MTVIIDGTNGVSDVDGSASTPAIRGTDANTGIFFPAADTIAFAEGGVEAMRIDSSGNVGIGTSSPSDFGGKNLQVQNSSIASVLWSNGTITGQLLCSSGAEVTVGSRSNHPLRFGTNDTERARIDTSGNFILTAAGNINLNIFNTQSLAQSGYQKFPNGLIVQWGRASLSGTSVALSFPITFPNAFWGIAGIPKYGSAIAIAFNGENTSGLTLRTSINTGDYFPYIAVGY